LYYGFMRLFWGLTTLQLIISSIFWDGFEMSQILALDNQLKMPMCGG
jgi:hypothetical protein